MRRPSPRARPGALLPGALLPGALLPGALLLGACLTLGSACGRGVSEPAAGACVASRDVAHVTADDERWSAVVDALTHQRTAAQRLDALRQAEAWFDALQAQAATIFLEDHGAEDQPEAGRAAAHARQWLARWAHGPDAPFRVGRLGFVLHDDLAAELAALALGDGDRSAAAVWLQRGGGDEDGGARVRACLPLVMGTAAR